MGHMLGIKADTAQAMTHDESARRDVVGAPCIEITMRKAQA